jgi:acetoin utilization deacetylase AcuC-like enzyme
MVVRSLRSIPVVWSGACLLHVPEREVWLGVSTVGTEVPVRVEVIRDAVLAAGHELVSATSHGTGPMARVHDSGLVEHLREVHGQWIAGGYIESAGQDRVVPDVFPTAAMLGSVPMRDATAVHARVGQYCYDTMTVVGPGTWEAIEAASDCALTAVDLVLDGAAGAYASCRPPGHHVTASAYGGSCYLNNAAVSGQALRDGGHDRVAVVDVDGHHGNGTQAIFYERSDVFYGSVHVDPGAGWFPHFVGYADETGTGDGEGATRNIPLAPGSGDVEFMAGVRTLAEAVSSYGATALVVSLGVDAAATDPESPLQVTEAGFADAGAVLLDELGLPVVIVQEGGYDLTMIGRLVTAFLDRPPIVG